MKKQAEFNGERARLYEKALDKYPNARRQDIDAMFRILSPREGEKILGIGEGNGYFCRPIAEAVGPKGNYLVTDPSKDQLENLVRRIKLPQVTTQTAGAEEIDVPEKYFDKVWSFGAFHHCSNQTEAMRRIYKSLKQNGKLVLCDVFQGSKLAKHFDGPVARYCSAGHEVKFLSDEFAKTLFFLAGFNEYKVRIQDLPQKWIFDSEKDLGDFIYNLHAMILLPGSEEERIEKTLEGCRNILGIEHREGKYELNWPMKALIAVK